MNEVKDVTVNRYPVTLDGDDIICYAAFHESLLKVNESWGETYSKVCEEGIVTHWGNAGFNVHFHTVDMNDRRPHINILPAKMTNTSYVMSRWWRWGWGLFRCSFHPETFMINWSRRHPGNIHLNLRRKYSRNSFMNISAHEFGHILGIGDAYAAHYRFFYEAPGTRDYMMNTNKRVSPEEAAMVRKAQQTGKMQFFPIRFSLKRVINGLGRR